MSKYFVYKHPFRGYAAVKSGWNWWAFLFSPFWCIFKGLWEPAIGIFILCTIAASIEPTVLPSVVGLVLALFVGAQGSDWRQTKLLKQGYAPLQTVDALSEETAIVRVTTWPGM